MKITSFTVILELWLVVIFLGTCTKAKAAGVPDENDCIVDREGKTLEMTFPLRKYSQAPGAFYAHLIRERNMTADIITCDKANEKISCIAVDHTFHVKGVVEDALKVRVPNVSSNLVDTFLLQVFFNDTIQPLIVCNLTMKDINSDVEDKAHNPGISDGGIAGILIAIIIIAIVVGVIVFRYRRKDPPVCGRKSDGDKCLDTTHTVLLPNKTDNKEEEPGEPVQMSSEETGLTGGNSDRNNAISGKHKETQSREPSDVSASKPFVLNDTTDNKAEQSGKTGEKSPEETRLTGGNRDTNKVPCGKRKEPHSREISAVPVSKRDTSDNKAKRSGKTEEKSPEEPRLTGGNRDTNKVLCGEQKDPHSGEISAVPVSKRDTTDNKAKRSGKTAEKLPEEPRSSDAEREGERSSNTQPEKDDELDSQGYPRYYYEKLSKEEEEKLLLSENNGPGSFLIKGGKDATKFFLSVNKDKEVRHYPFRWYGSTYILGSCVVTTMQALTDYYKKHDIEMFNDKFRLGKPVEDKAVSK